MRPYKHSAKEMPRHKRPPILLPHGTVESIDSTSPPPLARAQSKKASTSHINDNAILHQQHNQTAKIHKAGQRIRDSRKTPFPQFESPAIEVIESRQPVAQLQSSQPAPQLNATPSPHSILDLTNISIIVSDYDAPPNGQGSPTSSQLERRAARPHPKPAPPPSSNPSVPQTPLSSSPRSPETAVRRLFTQCKAAAAAEELQINDTAQLWSDNNEPKTEEEMTAWILEQVRIATRHRNQCETTQSQSEESEEECENEEGEEGEDAEPGNEGEELELEQGDQEQSTLDMIAELNKGLSSWVRRD